jgi:hypothetical protein
MLIDSLITRSDADSGRNPGDFGSLDVVEYSKEPDANEEYEEAIAYFGGIMEVMAMFRAVEGSEAAAVTLAAQ